MKRDVLAVLFAAALVVLRYILVTRADFTPNATLFLHIAAAAILIAAYFVLRRLVRTKQDFFKSLKEKIYKYL